MFHRSLGGRIILVRWLELVKFTTLRGQKICQGFSYAMREGELGRVMICACLASFFLLESLSTVEH